MEAAFTHEWKRHGHVVQAAVGVISIAYLLRKVVISIRRRCVVKKDLLPPLAKFQVYTNPTCPFANRVSIVLLELELLGDCKVIPIPLTSEITIAKENPQALPPWAPSVGIHHAHALNQLKQWYTLNFGLSVPTLVETCDGFVIKESDVICEYLSSCVPQSELFPSGRGLIRVRMAQSTFQTSLFYKLLSNKDRSKDSQLFQDILDMLEKFTSHMQTSRDGPYFLGPNFSFADIYAIPFCVRFQHTLLHYRGVDMVASAPVRFQIWFRACAQRASVAQTTPDLDYILKVYQQHLTTK